MRSLEEQIAALLADAARIEAQLETALAGAAARGPLAEWLGDLVVSASAKAVAAGTLQAACAQYGAVVRAQLPGYTGPQKDAVIRDQLALLQACVDRQTRAARRARTGQDRGRRTGARDRRRAQAREDQRLLRKFGSGPLRTAVAKKYLSTSRETKRAWQLASGDEKTTQVETLQRRHRAARQRAAQHKAKKRADRRSPPIRKADRRSPRIRSR